MKTLLLLSIIPFICFAQKPKEIMKPAVISLKKFTEKENFTKNDLLVITTLSEISHSDQFILFSQKEKLSDISLLLVSSSISTTYALIAIKDLKLEEDETKAFKSFIDRSGSYLSKNLAKHKINEKIKKSHNLAYELLVSATEKLDYKVKESKVLLKRFQQK